MRYFLPLGRDYSIPLVEEYMPRKEVFINRRYKFKFPLNEDDNITYECNVIAEICDTAGTQLHSARSFWSFYGVKVRSCVFLSVTTQQYKKMLNVITPLIEIDNTTNVLYDTNN